MDEESDNEVDEEGEGEIEEAVCDVIDAEAEKSPSASISPKGRRGLTHLHDASPHRWRT